MEGAIICKSRVASNQIQIGGRSNAIVYLYIPRKPETRYAGIRLSSGRTSLSLDHSARNARAGVVPAVFVGIGQLVGCNGAIRSAVPFRCFALRTYSTLFLSFSLSLPLPLSPPRVARVCWCWRTPRDWTSVRS